MMTTSFSLSNMNTTAASARFNIVDRIANLMCIRTLAKMYSGLMEETITPRFTLHLIHVQVAAFFAIAPVGMSLLLRVLFVAWMILSFTKARKAYYSQLQ